MEATHTISLHSWNAARPGMEVRERSPRFLVESGDGTRFFATVLMSWEAHVNLMRSLGVEAEDAPEVDYLLLERGLTAVEDRLRRDMPRDSSHFEIRISTENAETLLQARAKNCDYQLPDGRDLYCAAASPQDKTVVGNVGVRLVAPTSRSTCAACSMPDERVVCSHLHHPRVVASETTSTPISRILMSAFCDIGRPEVGTPHLCHAGGHPCWRRIVEPSRPQEVPLVGPRALLEAIDFLDTSWRLAFDRRPLVTIPSTANLGDLATECSSREEFQSRISAFDDVVKTFDIGDDQLRPGDDFPNTHTIERLRSALGHRLERESVAGIEAALSVLMAANRARVALQHSDAVDELPDALARLGVAYPIDDWEDAWPVVRSRITAALLALAEAVRRHALQDSVHEQ